MSSNLPKPSPISAPKRGKRVAIMQPYFLPYLGYWQLMQAVEEFVVYDDVQFSKGGWINRNRLFLDGGAQTFTLPLRKGSMRDNINERYLSDAWPEARQGLMNKFSHAYAKAPFYSQVMPLVEQVLRADTFNLADFLFESLVKMRTYLGIETRLLRSSDLGVAKGMSARDRVLAICDVRGADVYINAPGGRDLYDKGDFRSRGIDLKFIQSGDVSYRQFGDTFVPSLSILDVMMFNDPAGIREMLTRYTLE